MLVRIGGAAVLMISLLLVVAAGRRLAVHAMTAPGGSLAALASAEPGRPLLLVVFQPGDCVEYVQLLRRWQRLAERDRLEVVGVGLNFPDVPHERDALLDDLDLGLPVRFDAAGDVERLMIRMGYDTTPSAILLDGQGRPRVIAPATAALATQIEHERMIAAYVDHFFS